MVIPNCAAPSFVDLLAARRAHRRRLLGCGEGRVLTPRDQRPLSGPTLPQDPRCWRVANHRPGPVVVHAPDAGGLTLGQPVPQGRSHRDRCAAGSRGRHQPHLSRPGFGSLLRTSISKMVAEVRRRQVGRTRRRQHARNIKATSRGAPHVGLRRGPRCEVSGIGHDQGHWAGVREETDFSVRGGGVRRQLAGNR